MRWFISVIFGMSFSFIWCLRYIFILSLLFLSLLFLSIFQPQVKAFFQRISISFHILIAVVFLGFILLQRILRYNRSISFLISIIVILSLIYYYWKNGRWNTNYTTHNFTDINGYCRYLRQMRFFHKDYVITLQMGLR